MVPGQTIRLRLGFSRQVARLARPGPLADHRRTGYSCSGRPFLGRLCRILPGHQLVAHRRVLRKGREAALAVGQISQGPTQRNVYRPSRTSTRAHPSRSHGHVPGRQGVSLVRRRSKAAGRGRGASGQVINAKNRRRRMIPIPEASARRGRASNTRLRRSPRRRTTMGKSTR